VLVALIEGNGGKPESGSASETSGQQGGTQSGSQPIATGEGSAAGSHTFLPLFFCGSGARASVPTSPALVLHQTERSGARMKARSVARGMGSYPGDPDRAWSKKNDEPVGVDTVGGTGNGHEISIELVFA